MQTITGIVLAGGLARRMGGGDKGLLPFAGTTLAGNAADRLRPQVATVLINANRNQQTYAGIADTVIPDIIQGYAGPLAGIHAGMTAAKTEWVLTVPCDAPFFPLDLAARLAAAAAEASADIAIAADANARPQPVFMLARRALAEDIKKTLAAGNGKIDHWYTRLPHTTTPFQAPNAFHNINTPQSLAAAQISGD